MLVAVTRMDTTAPVVALKPVCHTTTSGVSGNGGLKAMTLEIITGIVGEVMELSIRES